MAALRPGGGGLMWRTAKADVAAELGLPPQHARLARLALSAIERHFYNRQHQVPHSLCSCMDGISLLFDALGTLRRT